MSANTLGFGLLVIGAVLLGGYGLFLLSAVFIHSLVNPFVKAGIIFLLVGAAVILVSVAKDRLKEKKIKINKYVHDGYEMVGAVVLVGLQRNLIEKLDYITSTHKSREQ